MKVSVIILNYNTFALTCNCIRSVIIETKGVEYEIILVDNASTECDADLFLQEFAHIKLVKNPINGGFANGNNKGVEVAKGEYLLLLNSDTILEEDAISKIIQYVSSQKNIGVAGCRMVYPNGRVQYTARRFRSISWELLDLFRFIPLMMMPYQVRAKRMLGKYFKHDENMNCDWLNGAFFLFPKSVLGQLSGQKLDDRFFMYGEDQLWCEQIKKLGYEIKFFADTTIIHINSGSTSLKKQLGLRNTMMKHELEIMRLRKGKGFYYYFFKVIYVLKEGTRIFIKRIFFRLTGKLLF